MSQFPPPYYGQPTPVAPGMMNYYASPAAGDPWVGMIRFLALIMAIAAGVAVLTHGVPLAVSAVTGGPMFPRGTTRVTGIGPIWWYYCFLWLRAILDAGWLLGAILLLARKPAATLTLVIYAVAAMALSVVNTGVGIASYLTGPSYGQSGMRMLMLISQNIGGLITSAVLPALIIFLMTRPRTKSYLDGQG